MTAGTVSPLTASATEPDPIEPELVRHHTSHRDLLTPVDAEHHADKPLDAIVVPSARPATQLRHAIHLAAKLDCVLLVLCSRQAVAAEVAALADRHVKLWAIDVRGQQRLLPRLRTSNVLVNDIFSQRSDVSFKRNLGLLIARVAGWERIVFLDDDMEVPVAADLRRAGSLTNMYDSVGLSNSGYPDNSVVCHAYRLTGSRQETFIGGGAMAVAAQRTFSFFPDVYNEDWFFLLNDARLRPTTTYGNVVQQPYDPFADPARAMAEEFGDCLAEGIYALLDQGRRVRDADERFWVEFLEARRLLIAESLEGVISRPFAPAARRRMIASLVAAERRRRLIKPARCVEFLRAWRMDLRTWRQYMLSFEEVTPFPAALSRVGVPRACIHRPSRDARLGRRIRTGP